MKLQHSKKGLGLTFWTGVGFLFAVVLFLVYAHPESVDKRASIGTLQLEAIKAKYQAEKALYFLDLSAKYALPYAILEAGEQGGVYTNPEIGMANECGSYIYELWNTKDKICLPEADKALKSFFNDRLNTYLRQYPGLPVGNYDYQVNVDARSVNLEAAGAEPQKQFVTHIAGFALQDLVIPILVEGTGQAKLSDFGGALRFPVQQANPVMSSCYGDRIVNGKPNFHDGIDIAVPEGTPLLAIADGEVQSLCSEWVGACACSIAPGTSGTACRLADSCSGKCGNYGNNLILKHAETLYSRYSHLKEVKVQQDQTVKKGDLIGLSGNTGFSQGAHLDMKMYISPDFGKDRAQEPFCFYADSQLALLRLGQDADSCAGELVDGKISKQSSEIQGYCAKIPPGVLQNLKILEDEQELSRVEEPVQAEPGQPAPAPAEPGLPASVPASAGESVEPATKLDQKAVERINSYQSIITAVAQRFNIPDENLIKAIMYQENKGNNGPEFDTNTARGLMQIEPPSWNDYCIKKGIVETNDYYDPQLNILCGTYILTQKYEEWKCGKGPQPYPYKNAHADRCCERGVCSQPGQTYEEWECAVRGYNGFGCSGDSIYVERVMNHFRAFGGQSIGVPEIYTDQLGSYSVTPNFKAEFEYNLDDYKTVSEFVSMNIIDSYDGSDPEAFLAGKMDAFNQQNPGLNMTLYCEAPLFYELAERYYDCLENGQKECVCEITLDNLEGDKDIQVTLLDNYFSLQNLEDVYENHRRVEFPNPVTFTATSPESQRQAQPLIQYLVEKNSRKFTKVYKNSESELTFITENPQAKPSCKPKKTMYSLCVEQKDTLIKTIEDQKLIEKPVKIRFSVYLEDNVPPQALEYTATRSDDQSSIILSWVKPAEDIDHFNFYVGETLAELSDLSTMIPLTLNNPEKATLPIEELEPNKFYFVEKDEPPRISVTYYYLYKPQVLMPSLYLALTGVDRAGNELRDVESKQV